MGADANVLAARCGTHTEAAFEGVDVVSKYVARLRLKARDARVFGFLAWGRYSPIVPAGLYDQINVSRNAVGTGPYRMVGFDPNDKVEYVRNPRFWKQGQPYMDAMTLKTLPYSAIVQPSAMQCHPCA